MKIDFTLLELALEDIQDDKNVYHAACHGEDHRYNGHNLICEDLKWIERHPRHDKLNHWRLTALGHRVLYDMKTKDRPNIEESFLIATQMNGESK